jgi:hypothetical protein
VNVTEWSRGLEVTGGGQGVVSHAGLALLRHLADKTGLTDAQGIRPAAPPFLDPGWYQGLVGARLAAQAGHGPRLRLVLRAPAFGRSEPEAGLLGQQGGPVVPVARAWAWRSAVKVC